MKEHLVNWRALCKFIRNACEEECLLLMNFEKRGERRATFLRRIHSRLNKLRADRERVELGLRK